MNLPPFPEWQVPRSTEYGVHPRRPRALWGRGLAQAERARVCAGRGTEKEREKARGEERNGRIPSPLCSPRSSTGVGYPPARRPGRGRKGGRAGLSLNDVTTPLDSPSPRPAARPTPGPTGAERLPSALPRAVPASERGREATTQISQSVVVGRPGARRLPGSEPAAAEEDGNKQPDVVTARVLGPGPRWPLRSAAAAAPSAPPPAPRQGHPCQDRRRRRDVGETDVGGCPGPGPAPERAPPRSTRAAQRSALRRAPRSPPGLGDSFPLPQRSALTTFQSELYIKTARGAHAVSATPHVLGALLWFTPLSVQSLPLPQRTSAPR